MFAYPKQAEFNKPIPKTKIYAHATVSKRLKELFVAQVAEIVWKYKLSPETTNLPARNGINEIEVFEILLRAPELDGDVLRIIDKAIPFPLIFQLVHNHHIRFAASYKRPSEADTSKWVIEATFQTESQPVDAPRPPLPVALDLSSLYEQIVRRHIPLAPRPGEGIAEHVARYNAVRAKEKECEQLENHLNREKQFNRKVELNAALRTASTELQSLQSA